jgi:branched-chain amino acid transport system ATP-binding protein
MALKDVALDVREREIIGLIGPNGAGKTTVFNAVTGVVKPKTGNVIFRDQDITGWKPSHVARQGIGRTFQNIRLYADLSVLENVMIAGHAAIRYSFFEAVLGAGRFTADERHIATRARELLELMGLTNVLQEKASSLPYGSQRKLEMARALALEPSLLLLDEPVAGMNPMETQEFGRRMQSIHESLGLSILLIEHDMGFVMDVCHRIRVIDHGIPIAWGTPEEIQKNPDVIKAYLGET